MLLALRIGTRHRGSSLLREQSELDRECFDFTNIFLSFSNFYKFSVLLTSSINVASASSSVWSRLISALEGSTMSARHRHYLTLSMIILVSTIFRTLLLVLLLGPRYYWHKLLTSPLRILAIKFIPLGLGIFIAKPRQSFVSFNYNC
ncbi:uncharacterized protein LOC143144802 [Ptiloglossa arizonensis]|uniref:uncharacterized protein LOC143144802 n=1 Tax=Ptiloglossa arizonensis TaxID=3350558 RepID=UPI003FA002F4